MSGVTCGVSEATNVTSGDAGKTSGNDGSAGGADLQSKVEGAGKRHDVGHTGDGDVVGGALALGVHSGYC